MFLLRAVLLLTCGTVPVLVVRASAAGPSRHAWRTAMSDPTGDDNFHARLARLDGEARVELVGEIDRAAMDDVWNILSAAITLSPQQLAIDLAHVTFMDSSGLHLLIDAHEAVTGAGGSFTLANVPARVRKLLDITGLSHLG